MKKRLITKIHKILLFTLVTSLIVSIFIFFYKLNYGEFGLLFNRANDIGFSFLLLRRTASILIWILFVGLTTYLGVTEIFPRLKKQRSKWLNILHISILLIYFLAALYSVYQIITISLSNSESIIIRLLYTVDLGMIFLGLLLYLMFQIWIPKIIYYKKKES